MDAAVVTVMLPNVEAAMTIRVRLASGDLKIDRGSVSHSLGVGEPDETTTAVVLEPDRPPLLIEGFLVRSLFAVLEEDPTHAHHAAQLLEAIFRRVSIPRRHALAYIEAIRQGTVLLALRTPSSEIERTCHELDAAGVHATSIHHESNEREPEKSALSQTASESTIR